ncbi:MAG: phosphomannomutase/phosphoglucomutase [Dehalococcoidia bacterium]
MTSHVNPLMFREYDIRGLVGRDLTEPVMNVLGRAAGAFFRRNVERPTIAVGRDVRLSSEGFAAAAITGLRSAGCEVIDVGQVPTPVLYFAVDHFQTDGGLCITASHNPPQFNGLKLRTRTGQHGDPLSSDEVQEVLRIVEGGVFAEGAGDYRIADAVTPYLDYIGRTVRVARPIRVVLDSGNGVTGPTAMEALRRIGAEVIGLYIEPDGAFPNHMPNPLKAENLVDLARTVREHGAAIGVGLDGDGDRLGVVDDAGDILWPDQYLIFLARRALAKGPSPVIFDVKCSMALPEEIERAGGTPVMTRTGYTNIARKRREIGGSVAGEFSGHIFFDDPVIDFDDGAFAACMLVQWLSTQDQPLSALMRGITDYHATPEERYACPDTRKFEVVEAVRAFFKERYETIDLDGVRVVFPDGWALVRASNTEPALTARYESRTPERLHEIVELVKAKLREFPEVDLEHE